MCGLRTSNLPTGRKLHAAITHTRCSTSDRPSGVTRGILPRGEAVQPCLSSFQSLFFLPRIGWTQAMDCDLHHRRMGSRSSTADSPSATSSEAATESDWECGDGPMAKIELQAAEALAGLASSAMPESWNWGRNEGEQERPTPRVKTESLAGDSRAKLEPSDQAEFAEQHCENLCSIMMKRVKVEHDAEFHKLSTICSTSYASFSGINSRQKLTEAEKEARRIRRVLANRESARKTIRRRQALYEGLTRNAASLACENENLKREKELAVKEYDSLKSTNEFLKAQMTKTMKTKVEETQIDSKSTNADISTSPCTNHQYLIYNQPPFTPFLWSSTIQSSNPIVVPSKLPMPDVTMPHSLHKEENPPKISGPGTPLYVLPCPWFFPLPDHGLQLRPSFNLNHEQNGTFMTNKSSASSSPETNGQAGKHQPSLPIDVKTDASKSTETVPACNLHETPSGFLPYGRVQQLDYTPIAQSFSSTVSHNVDALPEMKQDLIVCPSKKQVDANAAAKARKRRKELTKLKSLHFRHSRMYY